VQLETVQLESRRVRSDRVERVRMGEMVTDILHELNQTLAAIANYAQASARLLAADSVDPTEVRAALEQISAQTMRAGRIVRRLRILPDNPWSGGTANSDHADERKASDGVRRR
jgi:C4-dicarboxylate-specific signal transduction histidine kinase